MRSKKQVCSILAVAAVVLLLAGVTNIHAEAASSSEIREQINAMEEQRAQLNEQMQNLEAQLSENLTDIKDTVEQKENIDRQIFLLQDQLRLTEEQIAAYKVLIADKQEEVEEAQAAFDTLHALYKDRIRAMEETGKLSYWSVLFQANSFSELLDRLNIIEEIAAADNRRLQELQTAAEDVIRLQQELVEEKAALEIAYQEQLDSQQLLDEKRTEADELLQQLLAQGEAYEQLLMESEQRQEQLMLEIAQKEVEYDRAAYLEWLATYVPPTTTAPPTTAPTTSKPTVPESTDPEGTDPDPTEPEESKPPVNATWLTPVPYYTLTSPFGTRFHPLLNIWRMHNGVDMSCAEGTPIYASRSGVVTVTAYQEDGAGNYVQIDHGDGYKSIYMHMLYYTVSPGQFVTAGQTIGAVGSTGLSDGNHLHFGISYQGTYVNPMEYIS